MITPISPEIRTQILSSIKEGMSIEQAAETYHVTTRTISKWIRQGTRNAHQGASEILKARKEIEFLKSVILDLVLEQKASIRKG